MSTNTAISQLLNSISSMQIHGSHSVVEFKSEEDIDLTSMVPQYSFYHTLKGEANDYNTQPSWLVNPLGPNPRLGWTTAMGDCRCDCTPEAYVVFSGPMTGVHVIWDKIRWIKFIDPRPRFKGYHSLEDAEFAFAQANYYNLIGDVPFEWKNHHLVIPPLTKCKPEHKKKIKINAKKSAAPTPANSDASSPVSTPLSPMPQKLEKKKIKINVKTSVAPTPANSNASSPVSTPLSPMPQKLEKRPDISTINFPSPKLPKSGKQREISSVNTVPCPSPSPKTKFLPFFKDTSLICPEDVAPDHAFPSTSDIDSMSSGMLNITTAEPLHKNLATVEPTDIINDYFIVCVGRFPGVYRGLKTAQLNMGISSKGKIIRSGKHIQIANETFVMHFMDGKISSTSLQPPRSRPTIDISVPIAPSGDTAWWVVPFGTRIGIFYNRQIAATIAGPYVDNMIKCYDYFEACALFVTMYMTGGVDLGE